MPPAIAFHARITSQSYNTPQLAPLIASQPCCDNSRQLGPQAPARFSCSAEKILALFETGEYALVHATSPWTKILMRLPACERSLHVLDQAMRRKRAERVTEECAGKESSIMPGSFPASGGSAHAKVSPRDSSTDRWVKVSFEPSAPQQGGHVRTGDIESGWEVVQRPGVGENEEWELVDGGNQ